MLTNLTLFLGRLRPTSLNIFVVVGPPPPPVPALYSCTYSLSIGPLYTPPPPHRFPLHNVHTFVIAIAPIFSLYDVVPFPDPQIPAKIQPTPSTSIPENNKLCAQYYKYIFQFSIFRKISTISGIYNCTLSTYLGLLRGLAVVVPRTILRMRSNLP